MSLLQQGSGNEAPGSVGDSTGSRGSTRLKVVLLLYLSNCVERESESFL